MKLIPAGIKKIREAIERLMNGEVFYSPDGSIKLIYDDSNMSCGPGTVSPFRVVESDGSSEPINALWEKVADWQIEYKWQDDIGDGVLCWVSDSNHTPDESDFLRIITAYAKGQEYPYESEDDVYRFATALTLEEGKKHIKG